MTVSEVKGSLVKTGSAKIDIAQVGWEYYKKVRTWYRERVTWTVTVVADDQLYGPLHSWFVGQSRQEQLRALEVKTRRASQDDEASPSDMMPRGEMRLQLYYDERKPRPVLIGGHRVMVELVKPGSGGNPNEAMSYKQLTQPDRLTLRTMSREGHEAVLGHLREMASTIGKSKPALHINNSWGGWERRDDLPPRKLSTIALKAGQVERVRSDLVRFLDSEQHYSDHGIPWHRGYLLHGPAGTGKTSLIRALAYDLGLDLWYAQIRDLNKDASLLQIIASVRPRSILLLEDIDNYHAATDHGDDRPGVSMGALLNSLDGVATPHGMITFMTTNHLDRLDPSVIRSGRMDLIEELNLPGEDQARRLFQSYYGENWRWHGVPSGVSTADLIGVFQKYPDDPEGALDFMKRERIRV